MRRWVQGASALLHNAYLAFPWTGTLYTGPLKQLCTPGLNCYSCPAAVVSCPLGTLQHFLAALRPSLRWGTYQLGFYVVGLLVAVGLLAGRFPCGWLCPFGFLQDGLHRIPSPKLRMPPLLTWVRYGLLAALLVVVPLWAVTPLGHGEAWYCRFVCPAGTLEAGALLSIMPDLRGQLGAVFAWKVLALAAVAGWAVTTYRPYCRSLCPLGAVYGIFNRWSLLRVHWEAENCRDCRACADGCAAGVDPRSGDSPSCLRCFGCAARRCPTGALSVRVGTSRVGPKPCDPPSTRA